MPLGGTERPGRRLYLHPFELLLCRCISIYTEYSIFDNFNTDLNTIYIKNEKQKGREWTLGQIKSLAPAAYQLRLKTHKPHLLKGICVLCTSPYPLIINLSPQPSAFMINETCWLFYFIGSFFCLLKNVFYLQLFFFADTQSFSHPSC